MKHVLFQLPAVLLFSGLLFCQEKMDLYPLSRSATSGALEELKTFLAIPNDAADVRNGEKNLAWLSQAFLKRKFKIEILPTQKTPLFFAERRFEGADRTVLFYMHFDGQPVDPAEWSQPDPYQSVVKAKIGDKYESIPWERIRSEIDPEWRIFARSASDDKGPIIMLLQAIDLLDHPLQGKSKINVKVILDGEEEKGSQSLAAAVSMYRDKLAADIMLIHDGPIHSSDRPTLVFGCRGLTTLSLTAFGPRIQLHSGHYGNYAPNPAFILARLLAGMKDETGRVSIPGFYDGVRFTEEERKAMAEVPDDEAAIRRTIGIAEAEKVGGNYQESLQYPSLNVRGMQSAYIGDQARTIVPEKAIAYLDIRLVPESDPARLVQLVKEHMQRQGYFVIDREPTEEERLTQPRIVRLETGRTTRPFRTEMNSEAGRWLTSVIRRGYPSKEPVQIRIMGGSVPIAPFIEELKVPAVIVPLVNPDNHQHGPNENLRIWNLTNGIQTFLSILTDRAD